jgi:hypothetical protein
LSSSKQIGYRARSGVSSVEPCVSFHEGGVVMDWSYFVLAELLFFVLFLLFLLWQYLSLKKDKALLKAQREAETRALADAQNQLQLDEQAARHGANQDST